jgi:hypothetical protein
MGHGCDGIGLNMYSNESIPLDIRHTWELMKMKHDRHQPTLHLGKPAR